jgi:glycosyltransferase involved in cell wall biosynthesis
MKVVIDGVYFQFARSGIARFWSSILPHLSNHSDLEIVLLDRGNAPSGPGITNIAFPSYKMNSGRAADSFLIDRFCKALSADVFISTYYTTPVTIPSVLMVYDMIPEVLGVDLGARRWQEKQIAINFAVSYACVSQSTKLDLERFYPGTLERATVTYCGVDRNVFRPKEREDVERFKAANGITKPFYLLAGALEQHPGYENGIIAFKAVNRRRNAEIELICAGGEPQIAPEFLGELPSNVTARRLNLTDSEIACAYSAAEALIATSCYHGFEMAVLEAMACGCPVIAPPHGSPAEVAGGAAILVGCDDADGLANAMAAIRRPAVRETYLTRGHGRAAGFDWELTANSIHELLVEAHEKGSTPKMKVFFDDWQRLRKLQAAVDPF